MKNKILILLVVMLGVGIVFTMGSKNLINLDVLTYFTTKEPQKITYAEVNENKLPKLKPETSPEKKVVSIESFDRLNSKLTLLGVLFNQNTIVDRDGHPKEDLMFLNDNWTIDKFPNHLDLAQEDKDFLIKFIKP